MLFLLEYVPLTEMAVNPGGRPEGNTVSPDRHIADTLEHLHTGGQLPFTGIETVPTKARIEPPTPREHVYDFGP